jgi:hypothetical protein
MTPQLYRFVDSTRVFFGRHHPVIFFAALGLGLAAAVFALYQVLMITATPPVATGTITGFDEKTVQKIKQLHDSSNTNTTITLPSPRPNPFVE